MTRGLVAYGAYVPRHRLDVAAASATLEMPSANRGRRAVAAFDEDTTTMGVGAARLAMAGRTLPERGSLAFATSRPAYADKTNATAVHAALHAHKAWRCFDIEGTRAGGTALASALEGTGVSLVVTSDMRTGRPGSADELDGGDAAAAFLVADDSYGPLVAEFVHAYAESIEMMDRWRLPGHPSSDTSEPRFSYFAYQNVALDALDQALKEADAVRSDLTAIVASSPHERLRQRLTSALAHDGVRADPTVDGRVGFAGAADLGVRLAATLDRCAPGDLVACISIVDGVDVILLRATETPNGARTTSVADQLNDTGRSVPYTQFLTWRGFLDREPPRRPDPAPPTAPPSFRSTQWKFALEASKCRACGLRHLPPNSVCAGCGTVGHMTTETMASTPGFIRSFTVDHLAASLSPPVIRAIVDFDGGGRVRCEVTDADANALAIGDQVEMTFRLMYTTGTTHNYFWKARPVGRPNT